ncbi:glycosyltransferase involved in cell wall biosynthesis [Pacificimonas flava]|nr:glycosyltransferase involved in cell wall biosynthesis [Pacificimonas flava]
MGYDNRKMIVIPNGYDLSVFSPDPSDRREIRERLGIPAASVAIGFVARFDPQKDHRTLLQALSEVKSAGVKILCLLVGQGLDDANEDIRAQMGALGLTTDEIRLLGRRNDIPAVMNALDVHVMSSSSGEAFPNVLAEAMACGTPCVSTNVGDAADIIGDTGWLVPPRSPSHLAEAIRNALSEVGGSGWDKRRAAARHRVLENFPMEKMVKRFHDAWFDEG